jgi:hypothetical protein
VMLIYLLLCYDTTIIPNKNYFFIIYICSHVGVVYVLVLQVRETKLIMFICSHVGVVYVLVLIIHSHITVWSYQYIFKQNSSIDIVYIGQH